MVSHQPSFLFKCFRYLLASILIGAWVGIIFLIFFNSIEQNNDGVADLVIGGYIGSVPGLVWKLITYQDDLPSI